MKQCGLLAAILVLCVGPVGAESYRWNLDQALERALEKNLTLERAQITLRSKREASDHAWNEFLPSLDSAVSIRRTETSDAPEWSLSTEIGASLRIYASIRDQMERSREAYEAGKITHERVRQGLIRDVKQFFYQVLLYEARIRLAEQSLELAEGQYAKTESLFQAGLASNLDLLAARVSRENARPELLSLRNTYESFLIQMNLLTGLDPEDEITLVGDVAIPAIKPLDRTKLLLSVQESSLDIRELRHDLEAGKTSRTITARQTKVPNLSLGYSYRPSFGDPIADTIAEADNWKNKGSLTMTLSIPLDALIPHSKDDQKVRDADAGIEQTRLELEQALFESRIDVSNLLNTLAGTEETLRARELAEEQASESYAQTSLSYEQGGRSLLEVETARTNLLRARVAVLNETHNYIQTLIALEYALGETLTQE